MAAHNADFDTVLEYDPKCELVKTQPTNSRFVLDILLAKVQQPTAHTDFTAPQKSRAGKQPKGHDRARVQQSRGFWRGANVLREISGSVEDPRSRSEKLRPAGLLTIHGQEADHSRQHPQSPAPQHYRGVSSTARGVARPSATSLRLECHTSKAQRRACWGRLEEGRGARPGSRASTGAHGGRPRQPGESRAGDSPAARDGGARKCPEKHA